MRFLAATLLYAAMLSACSNSGDVAELEDRIAELEADRSTTTSSIAATTSTAEAEVALTDAERVWCGDTDNGPTLTLAIVELQVDGYEEVATFAAEARADFDVLNNDYAVNLLITGMVVVDWRPEHETAYIRACKAAFEGR